MARCKNAIRILTDILEVYIPMGMLLVLFISFVLGVFFRYVLKNPQSWTFEASSVAFLSFTILSACYVQRVDKHIEFDMIFKNMTEKTQQMMNMASNLIVAVTCAFLIPASISFVKGLKGLYTQVLDIPRGMVYWCMVVLFVTTCIRTVIRFVKEVISYVKDNKQQGKERSQDNG